MRTTGRRISFRNARLALLAFACTVTMVYTLYWQRLIDDPHDPTDRNLTILEKQQHVKKMMKHAWDGYVKYAWGKNELRPISKRGSGSTSFGHDSLGVTIVDSLDTLYIMGMKKEYEEGRQWVASRLDFNTVRGFVSAFEFNIRLIAGFLSCFSFTGDTMFRDKAVQAAQKILPIFNTSTGIPYPLINFKTGEAKSYEWIKNKYYTTLSEIGSFHLEFSYLSDITGDYVYRRKVNKIRNYLMSMKTPDRNRLFPNYLNPTTGEWGYNKVSLGAHGDSFYEYLLKSHLQSGKKDSDSLLMHINAMKSVTNYMLMWSAKRLLFLSEMRLGRVEPKMSHLACFAGALFGLGADVLGDPIHMDIARDLTNTCHESYVRSATGLGPEMIRFDSQDEAKTKFPREKGYHLRPEVVESYFVMWKLTKDQKYRDWGWEVVQALEKHCKVDAGYSGITDVYKEDSTRDDLQPSFFMAETLKYLYLLFDDEGLIELKDWVFNTEGHPLPIYSSNPFNRQPNS